MSRRWEVRRQKEISKGLPCCAVKYTSLFAGIIIYKFVNYLHGLVLILLKCFWRQCTASMPVFTFIVLLCFYHGISNNCTSSSIVLRGSTERKQQQFLHLHESNENVSFCKTGDKNVQLVSPHCCKTSWKATVRVWPLTFKPVRPVNNLIFCKTGLMWLRKSATLLFKSFRSNVARQVACVLLPFFLYLDFCLKPNYFTER